VIPFIWPLSLDGAETVSASNLVNRNVIAGRGRTSMRLEPELWEALAEICRMEQIGVSEMIRTIENRGHPGGRTSAVRVFIVQYFRGLVAGRSARAVTPHQPPIPLRSVSSVW